MRSRAISFQPSAVSRQPAAGGRRARPMPGSGDANVGHGGPTLQAWGTGYQPVLWGTGYQPALWGTGYQPALWGTGYQPVSAGRDRARPLRRPGRSPVGTNGHAGRGPLRLPRCLGLPAGGRCSPAFTIVELIVVVTVIILILAIAVPGLGAMNAQARLTAAHQTISGALTQAYHLAWANRNMTAVRLLPAEWDVQPDNAAAGRTGRQSLAIYSYVTASVSENAGGGFKIGPQEYFERAKEFNSALMPEDIWAAPLESLSHYGTVGHSDGRVDPPYEIGWKFVLDGNIGQFAFNADREPGGNEGTDGVGFLNADDFLIVCDARTGVRGGAPTPFQLRAYVPPPYGGYDASVNPDNPQMPYRRYAFAGVVTYRREPFTQIKQLDAGVLNRERQQLLKDAGRAYLAHRYGGGLVAGLQRPQ